MQLTDNLIFFLRAVSISTRKLLPFVVRSEQQSLKTCYWLPAARLQTIIGDSKPKGPKHGLCTPTANQHRRRNDVSDNLHAAADAHRGTLPHTKLPGYVQICDVSFLMIFVLSKSITQLDFKLKYQNPILKSCTWRTWSLVKNIDFSQGFKVSCFIFIYRLRLIGVFSSHASRPGASSFWTRFTQMGWKAKFSTTSSAPGES